MGGRGSWINLILINLVIFAGCTGANADAKAHLLLKSEKLCRQCTKCSSSDKSSNTTTNGSCPPSESYPHMTAFDNSLIAGALQSDYVAASDRGVYSVPNIVGGVSPQYNAYFGWESTSGSASGYHRFSNYMDKCSGGENYLTVEEDGGKVRLRSLKSLKSLSEADWKSINPPKHLNHREFRFWLSRSSGKCLTVLGFGTKTKKKTLGVAECKFDGANKGQLFAFRFHYHNTFCCCGRYNN